MTTDRDLIATEEIQAKSISGMFMLILNILLTLAAVGGAVYGLSLIHI